MCQTCASRISRAMPEESDAIGSGSTFGASAGIGASDGRGAVVSAARVVLAGRVARGDAAGAVAGRFLSGKTPEHAVAPPSSTAATATR